MKTAATTILALLAGMLVAPLASADTSGGTDCPVGLPVLVVCNKGYSTKQSCDGGKYWAACIQSPDGRWWHPQ
ncbi:hypothetical protein [Nocardia wallacei]|uniref:hypothetical protein n=1 Tax=Nocardia wallacei TaxID=480035 RepID=UPI0024546732|nr:hypothetical protein [Nocardia wallacei]